MTRQKHKKTGNRIYNIYRGMKTRCYTSSDYHYQWYGAKGIKICDEWLNDFMSFYNWALNNGYKEGLTIDRINNKGNYEPSNCKWSNNLEQANNKRNNHYVYYNGNKVTISQLSKLINIDRGVLYDRINNLQWCLDRVVNTPTRPKVEKGGQI